VDKFTTKISRTEEMFSKAYFGLVSFVGVIVVLIVNFKVMPALIDFVTVPEKVEKIKNRLPRTTAGFLVFIFLLNIFFWWRAKNLGQKRKQSQKALEINPADSSARKELTKTETEIKDFLSRMEFILLIASGLTITWMLLNVFAPIYGITF
jgi:hypothetical protein